MKDAIFAPQDDLRDRDIVAKRPEPNEPAAPERDPSPMPPEINPPTSHPHPDPAQPVT